MLLPVCGLVKVCMSSVLKQAQESKFGRTLLAPRSAIAAHPASLFRYCLPDDRQAGGSTQSTRVADSKHELLGWPLKPFEKLKYIGSPIKAIRENVKYPRGLPRLLLINPRAGCFFRCSAFCCNAWPSLCPCLCRPKGIVPLK